jgi:hypothetical protein
MNRLRLLTCLGLLAASALTAAWPAAAAKPHKGARYFGFEGSQTDMNLTQVSGKVRVSGSGRRFRRGSYVNLSCGRDDLLVRKLSLAGTRIRRNGKFSKVKRRGRVRYRLSGRFVLRDYARVSYSARSGRCRSRRRKVALYEKGVPPFKSCRSQRAKTDLRNGDGRVFEQLRLLTGEFYPHTYACLFSVNRRVLLGRNWDDETIETPRLTAPYVAYVSIECGVGSCTPSIAVRDLRDGALFRHLEVSSESLPGRPRDVESLVLKANGSVAWIVSRAGFMGSPSAVDVIAVDTTGRRVLDSGVDVDPKSLALTGSTLTWRKGGAARSASLN